jgi:multidrug efflux pump subunit AcrA (membrane-fusion protein)
MSKRNYLLIADGLLAVSLLMTAGCSKKEEKEAEPIAPVQVTPVTQGSIRRLVEADAVLYPKEQANVMPKTAAPVQKYLVNRGDRVKAGQLLAVLENRDLVAAAASNKGQLDQAEANLRNTELAAVPESVTKAVTDVQSDQEQFDAAKKVLESRQKLFQDGALARKPVDDAAVAFAQAKAQLETAKEHLRTLQNVGKQAQINAAAAAVSAAKGQLQSSQAQLAYTEIRSSIGGIVADRPVYVGDMAQPGSPLFTIVDISRVVARTNVPQKEALAVKVGNPATIKLTDGVTEVPGKVTVVSPATDPASTTVQVWVEAANPNGMMKPGASVHVTMVTGVLDKVTLVPAAAILPGEDGAPAVMTIAADSTAHLKKVEVGVRESDKVQILSGVSPGDQVISVGGLGLDDKAKVRIVKPGEKDEEPADEPAAPAGDAKKDQGSKGK